MLTEYLNSFEIAKMLGVNVSTVKRWTEDGSLDCHKTAGGHRKFLMSDLVNFLAINEKKKARIDLFPLKSQEDLETSLAIVKKDYAKLIELVLKQALTSQRQQVQQVMNGLYLARVPLYEIYDQLLAPVMHRIGALWLDKKVTIIEEHFATQTIRDSIMRLQGIVRFPEQKIGTAVCLSLSTELHDIALKMVDHILEERGFKVLFSGQLTPYYGIDAVYENFAVDRVYIASTYVENTMLANFEMEQIINFSLKKGVKIFVGGPGFDTLAFQHPQVTRLYSFQQVYQN